MVSPARQAFLRREIPQNGEWSADTLALLLFSTRNRIAALMRAVAGEFKDVEITHVLRDADGIEVCSFATHVDGLAPVTGAFAAAGTQPVLWEAFDQLIGEGRWWRRRAHVC